MVLEGLESNRVNIKDLTLESPPPTPKSHLDFLGTFGAEDLKSIRTSINGLKKIPSQGADFTHASFSFQAVFPQEASRINVSEETWQGIENLIFGEVVETEVLADVKLSHPRKFRQW